MKLKDFQDCINQAVEYAGDTATHVDVEIFFKKTCYEVRKISQFGLIPDVIIEIGEKTFIDD